MALPTSSTYASPIDLAAAYLEVEGDAITPDDDITATLQALAAASTDGSLYFQVPDSGDSGWSGGGTLYCDQITFTTYSITAFGCIQSDVAVTIALNGTGVNLWTLTALTDFVVGTKTAAASRNDYLLTFLGTWSPSNRGAAGTGYVVSGELITMSVSSYVSGTFYWRAHISLPKGTGIIFKTNGVATRGCDDFYVAGNFLEAGGQFSYWLGDKHIDLEVSDPLGLEAGWPGGSSGVCSTAIAETRKCGFGFVKSLGDVDGSIDSKYGLITCGGGFNTEDIGSLTNPLNYGTAAAPFTVTRVDGCYSGPYAATSGYGDAGVYLTNLWAVWQAIKWDGLGGIEEAGHRYIKLEYENNYGTGTTAYAVYQENNFEDDSPGAGPAWSSYIIWTLVNVRGAVAVVTPYVVAEPDNRNHHMTYRGDGENPAIITGNLDLNWYDTAQYGQFYRITINDWNNGHPTYDDGSHNTIQNCVLTEKIIVYFDAASGNTATNIKFTGSAREIINVAANTQIDLSNIEAPTGSWITVGAGATVTLNGNALAAGTHYYDSAWYTQAWPMTASDVPTLPGEVQYGRPASDVTAGTWTAEPAGDLYGAIDETTYSDADYCYSRAQADAMEVALSTLYDPSTSSGHVLRYRGVGSYTVSLREGTATEIASWVESDASLTTHERTLSEVEANSITDYGDLRVRVVSGSS